MLAKSDTPSDQIAADLAKHGVGTELLAARIRGLVAEAGGVENLITPRGYRHLGLAILDAVFPFGHSTTMS